MTFRSLNVGKPQALFFKALANPARMSIINLLQHAPRSVTQISEELGFERTMVSHHLKCLSFCGFVTYQRNGKNKIYSLNKETVTPILGIVDRHLDIYARNLLECEALKR